MQQEGDIGWCMTKRLTFRNHGLFKLKQIADNTFITHIPAAKRINLYDFSLTPLNKHLDFSHEMQAIEYLPIEGREFVMAGLKNGVIEGLELNYEDEQSRIQLSLLGEQGDNVYINDILSLGEGRLANCYNSGNIALWDVSKIQNQAAPIANLKKLHLDYIYKLRRVDSSRMVSCGNDHFTNLIDLETFTSTDSFYHSFPIWCCYPVDRNLLCSAGLLGYLSFRDIRAGAVVQVLQLLTNETSFVTHLDQNRLVFGDRRQVARCDLRMLRRESHCSVGMRVSAESILVTQEGGIAVGRGGDMCLFSKGNQQGEVEERNLKADNTPYQPISFNQGFFSNFLNNLQNIQNHYMPGDSDEQQQEDEQAEEDDDFSDNEDM